MAQDNRTPNWSCIVYEDSLPSDYLEQLEETAIEICLSPWHDMDIWSASDEKKNELHKAGTKKKKHRHIVIMYGKGNKKSIDQVKEDFSFLNGTDFKKVKSLPGMIQYLDHRYCKTKHHYDERDVISLNGFEYDEIVNLPTEKQTRLLLQEIRLFCRNNDIYDFCVLQDIVDDDEQLIAWQKVLDCNQTKIYNYITSRRCKRKEDLLHPRLAQKEASKLKALKEGFEENEIFDEKKETE